MWMPHLPGQHYDVRLTAPDGYRAQRSYSVASSLLDEGQIELTIDLLDDGEVSPYFHEVVQEGDQVELRGPFTSYFVWRGESPVLLVGGVRGGAADGDAAPPAPHDAGAGPAARVPCATRRRDLRGRDRPRRAAHLHPRGTGRLGGHTGHIDAELLREPAAEAQLAFVCGGTDSWRPRASLLVGLGMEPGNDPYGALRTHELTPGFRVLAALPSAALTATMITPPRVTVANERRKPVRKNSGPDNRQDHQLDRHRDDADQDRHVVGVDQERQRVEHAAHERPAPRIAPRCTRCPARCTRP